MDQLPQAVSRNHFLVAVEFMVSCFFRASGREREKALCSQPLTLDPPLNGSPDI